MNKLVRRYLTGDLLVIRPPIWLLVVGWTVIGLGWLSDDKRFSLLAFGLFSVLALWWGLWRSQQGGKP